MSKRPSRGAVPGERAEPLTEDSGPRLTAEATTREVEKAMAWLKEQFELRMSKGDAAMAKIRHEYGVLGNRTNLLSKLLLEIKGQMSGLESRMSRLETSVCAVARILDGLVPGPADAVSRAHSSVLPISLTAWAEHKSKTSEMVADLERQLAYGHQAEALRREGSDGLLALRREGSDGMCSADSRLSSIRETPRSEAAATALERSEAAFSSTKALQVGLTLEVQERRTSCDTLDRRTRELHTRLDHLSCELGVPLPPPSARLVTQNLAIDRTPASRWRQLLQFDQLGLDETGRLEYRQSVEWV